MIDFRDSDPYSIIETSLSYQAAMARTLAQEMEKPGYRGDWNEEQVAKYLLGCTAYTHWTSEDGSPPAWIKEDGSEWEMMDDIDDRWYAVWKFVADRGEVDRKELAAEFSHLGWSG